MSAGNAASKMNHRVEGRTLVLERTFNAPRELVFQAFSEAEHLRHWWGPRGWELPVCNIDFRPGGVWLYCMKCMDKSVEYYGQESWGKAIYHEIEPPEKIVYTDYFTDAEGNISEEMPAATVTITFLEEDGKTRIVNHAKYESEDALKTVMDMGMLEGITETWDRLEEHLAQAQAN